MSLLIFLFHYARELGEQEALKKQNQNKLLSADEVTRSVQQELDFIRLVVLCLLFVWVHNIEIINKFHLCCVFFCEKGVKFKDIIMGT